MEEKDYLKDISEIKNMMDRSSQFISLSGLSGILAGVYALIGASVAHVILTRYTPTDGVAYSRSYTGNAQNEMVCALFTIAIVVVLLSIATGVILSIAKARKNGDTIWNRTSQRLIVNFMIPLATGGIFALVLLRDENFALIAPATLIFYGLACVNAGKYTFRDVSYLGITMTLIGLIAAEFPGYGLYFWALGFGVCHIIYGTIMHFKYDRK